MKRYLLSMAFDHCGTKVFASGCFYGLWLSTVAMVYQSSGYIRDVAPMLFYRFRQVTGMGIRGLLCCSVQRGAVYGYANEVRDEELVVNVNRMFPCFAAVSWQCCVSWFR